MFRQFYWGNINSTLMKNPPGLPVKMGHRSRAHGTQRMKKESRVFLKKLIFKIVYAYLRPIHHLATLEIFDITLTRKSVPRRNYAFNQSF